MALDEILFEDSALVSSGASSALRFALCGTTKVVHARASVLEHRSVSIHNRPVMLVKILLCARDIPCCFPIYLAAARTASTWSTHGKTGDRSHKVAAPRLDSCLLHKNSRGDVKSQEVSRINLPHATGSLATLVWLCFPSQTAVCMISDGRNESIN